ncbi:MAG: hypothetical protein V1798_12235 [Pseudomonadota bacterium]
MRRSILLLSLVLLIPAGVLGGPKHKPKLSKVDAVYEKMRLSEKVHDLLAQARDYIENNSTVMATVHLINPDIEHFVARLRTWRISTKPDGDHVSANCAFSVLRGDPARVNVQNLDERLADLMKAAWPEDAAGKVPVWFLRVPITNAGWCEMYTAAMVSTTAPYALVVDIDQRHSDATSML